MFKILTFSLKTSLSCTFNIDDSQKSIQGGGTIFTGTKPSVCSFNVVLSVSQRDLSRRECFLILLVYIDYQNHYVIIKMTQVPINFVVSTSRPVSTKIQALLWEDMQLDLRYSMRSLDVSLISLTKPISLTLCIYFDTFKITVQTV